MLSIPPELWRPFIRYWDTTKKWPEELLLEILKCQEVMWHAGAHPHKYVREAKLRKLEALW